MKEREYIVNMGFTDDQNGRMYSAGQTLTQIEYNLLPMNMKVRCSEKFSFGFDDDDKPVKLKP